jgi:sigma-E factor negative regulatory protein RseA
MADHTAEQLSLLVDGECEVPETELLLRRLTKDTVLKARWQRYYLIGDAMKNSIPEVIDPCFAERVSRAVETDTGVQTHSPPWLPSWYKPVTGFALAASVAAVILLGLRFYQRPDDSQGPVVIARHTGQRTTEQDSANSALQSRLNSYLVNHSEYASVNSVPGMLPYVRMVGYEPER